MSQPADWTVEEAERLGAIARGECLHSDTIDMSIKGDHLVTVVCLDCDKVVATMDWSEELP